jgi:hypothetical protein
VALGCAKDNPLSDALAGKHAPAGAPARGAEPAGGYLQDASSILAAFKAKIGGPVHVLELTVYPDHVAAQIQDPKKQGNVDEYELRDGGFIGLSKKESFRPSPIRQESAEPPADVGERQRFLAGEAGAGAGFLGRAVGCWGGVGAGGLAVFATTGALALGTVVSARPPALIQTERTSSPHASARSGAPSQSRCLPGVAATPLA